MRVHQSRGHRPPAPPPRGVGDAPLRAARASPTADAPHPRSQSPARRAAPCGCFPLANRFFYGKSEGRPTGGPYACPETSLTTSSANGSFKMKTLAFYPELKGSANTRPLPLPGAVPALLVGARGTAPSRPAGTRPPPRRPEGCSSSRATFPPHRGPRRGPQDRCCTSKRHFQAQPSPFTWPVNASCGWRWCRKLERVIRTKLEIG